MNKEFERYLIVFLLLVLIGLAGCVKKQEIIKNPTLPDAVEQPTNMTSSVGKMESIANALGCMFAPETCPKGKDTKETDR